jgi:periplasmic protein TonB
LPSGAESAKAPPFDTSELDTLPPHRAAVPVPPVVLTEALAGPHRNFSPLGLTAAWVLHGAFLAAAVLWGQGGELPLPDEPIAVELVDSAAPVAAVQEAQAAPPSAAEPDNAPQVGTAQAAVQPPIADQLENQNVDSSQPRERAVKTLAKLKRLLAALSALPAAQPQMTPSLPRPAPRLDRATIITSATATAPLAAGGYLPAPGQGPAKRVVLAIYKQRVRTRIQRNLPISSPAPGRLVIGLRLSHSGRLLSALVLRSSGSPLIDRAALHCVRAAGPYPAPPPGTGPAQLALAIAFRFE